MKQLTDTIYQVSIPTPFAVGNVHTYLIKGERLTLIDAGVKTDEAWEAMKYELNELGYHPNDIEQIVLTHHHPLQHISSNPLLEPPRKPGGERPRPLVTYRETLMKCLNMPIGTVYPGHGSVFEKPHELIQTRLIKQEERAEKVYNMLTEAQTPFEVCKQLFPRHIEKQFGLTMSETMGQLDYLESTHRVNIELCDGVYYYQAK